MRSAVMDKTMDLLGIQKPKKRQRWTERSIGDYIRKGFPFPAVEKIKETLGIDNEDMARILAISPKTLSRKKTVGKIQIPQSNQLYRIARIFAFAEGVLGDKEAAVSWLNTENRALGGVKPIDLLDTATGEKEIENLLGAIEHGIYT